MDNMAVSNQFSVYTANTLPLKDLRLEADTNQGPLSRYLNRMQALMWALVLVIVGLWFNYLRKSRRTSALAVSRLEALPPEVPDELFESAPIGFLEVDRDGIV